MDFKQIEAFVNVVRYKSFSRAADATFFTQPTISTHISTLERELGTQLLVRKGRVVEMTPQGQNFYKYAIEMVNTRARAIEALDQHADAVAGVLEIQTSSIPGIVFLPELLQGFHQQYPRTQFYVELSDSKEAIENLRDRRGELAFIGEKSSDQTLEYVRLFSDRVVLVIPEGKLPEQASVSIEEITEMPLIWRESGSATRKSFEDLAATHGFDRSQFQVVARINDLNLILRAVEQGLGAAILSERTVERCGARHVRVLDIADFEDRRMFYMVSQRGVHLSPQAEAFRKYVLDSTPTT